VHPSHPLKVLSHQLIAEPFTRPPVRLPTAPLPGCGTRVEDRTSVTHPPQCSQYSRSRERESPAKSDACAGSVPSPRRAECPAHHCRVAIAGQGESAQRSQLAKSQVLRELVLDQAPPLPQEEVFGHSGTGLRIRRQWWSPWRRGSREIRLALSSRPSRCEVLRIDAGRC